MTELDTLFEERRNTPHNIDKHMLLLRSLVRHCEHITEFGTDVGFSTTAFLAGRPQTMVCYDVRRRAVVERLERLAHQEGITLEFHREDTRTCEVIAPTDLLFIDSEHTYGQVRAELERHGNQARRFLVFHDTITFPGIMDAITEFLEQNPHWEVVQHFRHQHGLLVCRRREGDTSNAEVLV